MMEQAITIAKQSGMDIPVGAVIVKDGLVISSACNQKEVQNDVTSHAEILAIRKAEQAIVNVYEFTSPANCRIKRFDSYDKEWLDFIVESRTGKQPWKGFDIIEGGIANDRVIDAVEAYIQGYADVEHTLRQLIYQKPNYQICI